MSSTRILFTAGLAFFCVLFQSAVSQYEIDNTCPLTDDNQSPQILSECLNNIPNAQSYIGQIMSGNVNSDIEAQMENLVCNNANGVAKALTCILDKAKPCMGLPEGELRNTVYDLLPNERRFESAMTFACENRESLDQAAIACFQQVQEPLNTCLGQEMASEMQSLNVQDNSAIKEAVCRAPKAVETCLNKHRGSCSQDFVRTLSGIVNRLSPCSGATTASVSVLVLAAALIMSVFNKLF